MTSTPKPARKYPGIEAVRSGGRWKWRGRARVVGRMKVGPLRASQAEAHADHQELRERGQALERGGPQTLGEGLAAVVRTARSNGIREATVQGVYAAPGRALLRDVWDQATSLEALDEFEVKAMVRRMLELGRNPRTISKGYLRVLHLAFQEAHLPSPVPGVRVSMRGALRAAPAEMPWFTPEEFARLRQQIRDFRTPSGARTLNQDRDLAVIELLGLTGIRRGEFSRLRVSDFDLERGVVHVREAKVRTMPRRVPIGEDAVAAARVLLGDRGPDELVASERILNHLLTRWRERLEEPRLSGRALRHSYGTGLVIKGAPLQVVRDLMGHSRNSSMTLRYLHAGEEHQLQAVIALEQAVRVRGEGTRPDQTADGE